MENEMRFDELNSVKGIHDVNNAMDRSETPYVCITLDVNEYGTISTITHRGTDPIGSKCIEYDLEIGQMSPATATTGKMRVWLAPRGGA